MKLLIKRSFAPKCFISPSLLLSSFLRLKKMLRVCLPVLRWAPRRYPSLHGGDMIRSRTAAANERTSFSSASRRERAARAESSSGSGEENSSERARRAIMVLWRGLRRQVMNTDDYLFILIILKGFSWHSIFFFLNSKTACLKSCSFAWNQRGEMHLQEHFRMETCMFCF